MVGPETGKVSQQASRLLTNAGVLIENYRGRKSVAHVRSEIIYTSVRAFGREGPWIERGFDLDADCPQTNLHPSLTGSSWITRDPLRITAITPRPGATPP